MSPRPAGDVTAAAQFVTTTDAHGAWVWCGVEVRAASDLTAGREYASLDERGRQEKGLTAQQAWLRSLLAYPGAVVELRWITEPGEPFMSLGLLGRVRAADEPTALDYARHLQRRLDHAPELVLTKPMDREQLLHTLDPFTPAAMGAGEVRKWTVEATPTRPDAHVQRYYAVYPFHATTQPWNELLAALAEHPHRTMLSVALEVHALSPGLPEELDRYATFFGRLTLEGELAGVGLHGGRTRLAPEALPATASGCTGTLPVAIAARPFTCASPSHPRRISTTACSISSARRSARPSAPTTRRCSPRSWSASGTASFGPSLTWT